MPPTTESSVRPYRSEPAKVRDAFLAGDIPVAVYGLGKMGLPLAGVYAEVTGNVIGADVDPEVAETVNRGDCHVKREPGLDDLVSGRVSEGALRATDSPREAAASASIHVVIVPTPIEEGNEPDLSILEASLSDLADGIASGDLVLLESTVPPGTTDGLVVPRLEAKSGLSVGEFGVAFCPERTSSGRAIEDIRGAYPKVVGGIDEASASAAELVYEEINAKGVLTASDATTAEAVKLFEGMYRHVNIGLANELATFADELGISVLEAIDVANTQPYCDIHEPGPGVGGHCIPYYPYFLMKTLETDTPLIRAARDVNESMPAFAVAKLREEFDAEEVELAEATVLILGLTYRPGVAETRASPAIDIAAELTRAEATVYGVDPMLDDFEGFELEPLARCEIYDRSFDAVVLVTPHEEFEAIRWPELARSDGGLIVVDGRGTLDLGETDHRVYTIGEGRDV